MPPEDAGFADTTRGCSFLKEAESVDPAVAVRLVMDRQQESLFDQALGALRAEHGADRPDRMASRVYRNDRLVKPAFDEAALDSIEGDPWAVREPAKAWSATSRT